MTRQQTERELPLRGGGGSQAAASGLASVPNSVPADLFEVNDLLSAIESGRYRPTPGSFGAALLGQQACGWHGRSLALFARAAIRGEGIWWAMALEAHPNALPAEAVVYAGATWRRWIHGDRRAFSRSRQ